MAQAQVPEALIPDLSTSTTTSVNYDMDKVSSFTLSSMDMDWRNPGKGFSGQISYDVVAKHFMGLNVAYRFADAFQLKAGIMKMAYITELSYSPRTLECCGYSLGTSYLGGYTKDLCGLQSRARDVGIMALGNLWKRDDRFLVSYTVGVFNGNAYSFKDDNNAKNFAASVLVYPTASLKLSMGTLLGKYTVDETGTLGDRNRFTAGLWYDEGKYFVKAENIYGKTGELQSNGSMLMAGLWFRKNMAVAVRGDNFFMDLHEASSRINKADICFSHTLGKIFRYRVQYGHTFYCDPDRKDSDVLTFSMKFDSRNYRK